MEHESESERAAVEVARVTWGSPLFPLTPDDRDRLLSQLREITGGLDPAEVMVALGALLQRGIDWALDEGRDDEAGFEETEHFFKTWIGWEERRADRS